LISSQSELWSCCCKVVSELSVDYLLILWADAHLVLPEVGKQLENTLWLCSAKGLSVEYMSVFIQEIKN
jgi:hypothetical protein